MRLATVHRVFFAAVFLDGVFISALLVGRGAPPLQWGTAAVFSLVAAAYLWRRTAGGEG